HPGELPACADQVSDAATVGLAGAFSSDAEDGRSVLADLHGPGARTGLSGRFSRAVQSLSSALGPAAGGEWRSAGAGGGLGPGSCGADTTLAAVGEGGEGETARDDGSGMRRRMRRTSCQDFAASCRRPGGRGPSPWTPYPQALFRGLVPGSVLRTD